ncbi:acyl-CoA synthetase [Amorphus sp. 3PC139-8]|uniref:acyl-CoA synthetase n=1 Tax=Amorphus sp. 3PC139-8 TaxID=2735676 RepID=UPI00345CA475
MAAFDQGLDRRMANFAALSPLGFLERSASVYPNRLAVVHGERRYAWAEVYDRARQLASVLADRGIGKNDTVAVMLANTPEMIECHFGVPMTGAVLNALNIRLDAAAIAFMLDHGEAKLVICDTEFAGVMREALDQLGRSIPVVDVDDALCAKPQPRIGELDYETFIAAGDPAFAWAPPADEWDAIALNYTSGTTGDPKGVVYHHRGAYLTAMGNVMAWDLAHHPIYLWTLPMFHCNGWCFPWTVAALAGTNICLRQVSGEAILNAVHDEGVTHFCGAPIVLSMVVDAVTSKGATLPHIVKVMTAAAPPPASTLEAMERAGFDVTHVYGLTEVYGPAVVCSWHEAWDALPVEERARLKSRQGVRYHVLAELKVLDPETLEEVPHDGETIGEIMFRGNVVAKGYLKNPTATDTAFGEGWFHSGDLAVVHPDGYLQIRDRSKDIIISGGENISSVEVEDVIYRHPAVAAVAVVARPDAKWGETPCAFVELRAGKEASEDDIIAFCREHLAHYKCPRTVVFAPLPKTSTGKIQKFELRSQAKTLS